MHDRHPGEGRRARVWTETLVRLLDDGWRVPGTPIRFGLDALLGFLLPGVGDVLTSGGSLALLGVALQRGVPTVVILRMLLNMLLDGMVGVVPVVGDAFDVYFKSNRRNLILLERASREAGSGRAAHPLDYVLVGLAAAVLLTLASMPLLLLWWMARSSAS